MKSSVRLLAPTALLAFSGATLMALAACGPKNDTPPATPPPNNYGPPPPYGYGTPPPTGYAPGAPPYAGPGAPPPAGTFAGPPGAPPPAGPAGTPPAGAPPTGAPAGAPPFGLPFPIPTGFGLPPAGGPPAGGPAPTGSPSGPSAQPLDPNLAVGATAALNLVAASETSGMQKEGAPIAGNFQEGQVLEQGFTMQPGRCYTVVAAGVGPQELELTIVPTSPIPNMPTLGNMGSAKGSGQKTVLGGGGNCVKLAFIPVAVGAKLVLKSSRGAGVAAAQIFAK